MAFEAKSVEFSLISASNLVKADSRSESDAMVTFKARGMKVQTRRIVSNDNNNTCHHFSLSSLSRFSLCGELFSAPNLKSSVSKANI